MSKSKISHLPISENQFRFCELSELALAHAKKIGASDAAVEVSENRGLSVSVRNLELETVEQTRDRGLSVTVFDGQKRGSASTSDFSPNAIQETVAAAWHIAKHTAEDDAAGLADSDQYAMQYNDLQLYTPWELTPQYAQYLALRAEAAALEADARISNSEGASVDTMEGHFVLANSRGFLGGYPYSRHTISVSPIAGNDEGMQRDYWYSAARNPMKLASPEEIGRIATQRTVSRLGAKRIKTGNYPVLFEAPLAVGLLGAFVQATSGGALYRKSSFLYDSLGQDVFANHLTVLESPHIKGGMGSAPFDGEGIKTAARSVIQDGVLEGYFLSTYTARKLGMKNTGNAGGSHNLTLRSSNTLATDDLPAMLKKMGTGLLVTEVIGQGVNYLTGDYSRGAFGYWVENGEIQYPVEEITIAGNLRQMFLDIVAVGADTNIRGSKATGSILIAKMAIAGS